MLHGRWDGEMTATSRGRHGAPPRSSGAGEDQDGGSDENEHEDYERDQGKPAVGRGRPITVVLRAVEVGLHGPCG